MSDTPTLSEVIRLIKLIINQCDDGLAVLLGMTAPPSAVDVYEMRRAPQEDYGVRIDGGEDVPHQQAVLESRQEEVVKMLGGWGNISRAFREFRKEYPETWRLFEMSSMFVRPGGIVRDGNGGATVMIGKRFDGITAKTLRRRREAFLRTIALFLITRPSDEEFRLYDDPVINKKLN